jgi:uncharacterized protein
MWILIGAVVSASLLGSVHCVGMCGPLALWASGSGQAAPRTQTGVALTLYHLGRLVTYAVAGAIAGWFGQLLDAGGELLGLQLVAARVVGMAMMVLGGWQLWNLRATVSIRPSAPSVPWMTRILLRLRPFVFRLPLAARGWFTGLLTALLPCGWLYLFALVAAGSGSWQSGMTLMSAFWLGTVPALTGLVIGARSLAFRYRKLVPACVAILLIAGGGYTASGRGFSQLESLAELQAASRRFLGSMAEHERSRQAVVPSNDVGTNAQQLPSVAKTVETLIHTPLPCCAEQSPRGDSLP